MASTLYEYYTGKGQSLPSVSERAKIASQAGISGYSGTASQNSALLAYLQGSGSSGSPKSSIQTPSTGNLASGTLPANYGGKLQDIFGDNPEDQAKGSEVLMNAYKDTGINNIRERQPNESVADYAARLKNEPFYLAGMGDIPAQRPRTLSVAEVKSIGESKGLKNTGFNFSSLAGMTADQANRVIDAKVAELKGMSSQNTSFALNSDYFNPISSAKKIFDSFNIGIKSAMNPLDTEQKKNANKNGLIGDTAYQLGQLFDNPANFDTLYATNSDFKRIMDALQKSGVSIDSVKSNIVTKQTNDNGTIKNPLDLGFDGTKSLNDVIPTVKTDKPLLKDMADTTNKQIADLAGVPEQMRQFYLGDTGYFTKIRQDAEANLKSLDESYKTIERDTEADYQANVQKAEFEAQKNLAQIEESRVDAKNYMTGMLAKLGALTTTGEAPAALGRLEAKYQSMANDTKNALFNAKAQLASDKAKTISAIQTQKLEKMQAIRSDVTKSSYEVQKDLMNIDRETKKEINGLISAFNKESLDLDKKAMEEATKLKEAYLKKFATTASGGAISGNTYGSISGQAGAPKISSQAQTIVDAILNGQGTLDTLVKGTSREVQALRSEVQAGLNFAMKAGTYANPDVIKATDAINNLLQDKNLGSISGLIDQFIGGYAGDSVLTKNRYDQLMNTLLVLDRGKLKGQGAITDFETKMLRDAISSLSRGVNDSQFKQGLLDIRGILNLNSGYTVPAIVNGQNREIDRNQYYDLVRQGTPVKFNVGEAKTPLSLNDIGVGSQPQAPETKVVNGVTYVRVNGGWKKQ